MQDTRLDPDATQSFSPKDESMSDGHDQLEEMFVAYPPVKLRRSRVQSAATTFSARTSEPLSPILEDRGSPASIGTTTRAPSDPVSAF